MAEFIKNLFPRSLLGRSVMIIVMPVVLLQAVVTLIFFDRHWDTVNRRLSRGVAADIAMLIQTYDRIPDNKTVEELALLAQDHMMLVTYMGADDELPEREPLGFLDTVDRTLAIELEQQVGRPFWVDTDREGRLAEIRIQLEKGVLYVLVPKSRIYATTAHIFILWMIGSSILLLAIAILFLRNQVRPILNLAEAAESFGRGQDMPEFKPTGATEVRQAARSFMEMKERIERHIQQRTNLLTGVSHDLRTPLTRLKLQLAMMGDEDTGDLKKDVAEMERMVQEFLDFSRGQDSEAPVLTDIGTLLIEVASDAARKGIAIDLNVDPGCTVSLRPLAIKRCMMNLLDNAHRFAAQIRMVLTVHKTFVEIVVDDDGPGIPEEQREEAMKPFTRLDASRDPNSSGVGLGLSIVRDAVHVHGGELTLGESPMGGLRAIIHLPR